MQYCSDGCHLLMQVAQERSSIELQAVCTEVAGECLPNVVVSYCHARVSVNLQHAMFVVCCNCMLSLPEVDHAPDGSQICGTFLLKVMWERFVPESWDVKQSSYT